MKNKIFLTTCLLVWFTNNVFVQSRITREGAYRIVKQKGLVDTLGNAVRVSRQTIPPNTVIKLMIDSIISPASDSWFFFIDEKPFYDWAHPCKYVFFDTSDSTLTIINGQFDIYMPMDVILTQKNKYLLPTPDFIKNKSHVFNTK